MNLKKQLTDRQLVKFLADLLDKRGISLPPNIQTRVAIVPMSSYLKGKTPDPYSHEQQAALAGLLKRKSQLPPMIADDRAEAIFGVIHHSASRRLISGNLIPTTTTFFTYYVHDASITKVLDYLAKLSGSSAPIEIGHQASMPRVTNFEMLHLTRTFPYTLEMMASIAQGGNAAREMQIVQTAIHTNFRDTHAQFVKDGDPETGQMLYHAMNVSVYNHGSPHPEIAGFLPLQTLMDANNSMRLFIARESGLIFASHDEIDAAGFLAFTRGERGLSLAAFETGLGGKARVMEMLGRISPAYAQLYSKISQSGVTERIEKLADQIDDINKGKIQFNDPRTVVPVIIHSFENGTVYQNTRQVLIDDLYKATGLKPVDAAVITRIQSAKREELMIAIHAVANRRYLEAVKALMPKLYKELVPDPELPGKLFPHLAAKPTGSGLG